MRVLFVSAEIFPLVKTGGLADVSAALPHALTQLGVDVQLILPGYPQALAAAVDKSEIATLPQELRPGGKSPRQGAHARHRYPRVAHRLPQPIQSPGHPLPG